MSFPWISIHCGGLLRKQKILCESLSWIKTRSVDKFNWIMVGVCSPSIGDERCIFTYSIPFRIKEIFKSKVSLIQKLKGIKGLLKHLAPHWRWSGHLKCLNRGKWEQKVYPLSTRSFHVRLGRNHAPARATACTEPVPELGLGPGRGSGCGCGRSLGPVLFKPGHTSAVLQWVSAYSATWIYTTTDS